MGEAPKPGECGTEARWSRHGELSDWWWINGGGREVRSGSPPLRRVVRGMSAKRLAPWDEGAKPATDEPEVTDAEAGDGEARNCKVVLRTSANRPTAAVDEAEAADADAGNVDGLLAMKFSASTDDDASSSIATLERGRLSR